MVKLCKKCGETNEDNFFKLQINTCKKCYHELSSNSRKALWKDDIYRQKIINSLIGIPLSEEHKNKLSIAHTGKKLSEEHKKNISKTNKIKFNTPEMRQQLSNTSKWSSNRPEIRDKISKNTLEAFKREDVKENIKNARNEEYRTKMSNTMSLRWEDPIIRQKYLDYMHSEENINRMSKRGKELMSDPEHLKKMMENNPYFKNTKPELEIKKHLDTLGIRYIAQKFFGNLRCCADFYLPKSKTIIEVDGRYWHNYPYGTDRDREKDILYKDAGLNVVRIWEKETTMDNLKNKLGII